jgi:CRISPR/Cas system Type II protein with McrA/HNH and RuvC-like nuclease domain
MTDQEIRLLCGELTANEMRLARAIISLYERRIEKLLGVKSLGKELKNNG